ncbi:hypothetical protein [Methylobacterium sp. Gmos1]
MTRADDLRALLAKVEEATGPSRTLEDDLALALGWTRKETFYASEEGDKIDWVDWVRPDGTPGNCPECWTEVLDCAKLLVAELLPGFWHSTTTCWRTADADIGPDFTGPHGDDLLAAGWSQEEHDGAVFQAVVAPGGPIHAECLALVAATLKALIAREALAPPSPEVLATRRAALAAMKAEPTRAALIAREEVEHGR